MKRKSSQSMQQHTPGPVPLWALFLTFLKIARLPCAFLGVPFRETMLDYHRTEEAKRAARASELLFSLLL